MKTEYQIRKERNYNHHLNESDVLLAWEYLCTRADRLLADNYVPQKDKDVINDTLDYISDKGDDYLIDFFVKANNKRNMLLEIRKINKEMNLNI